MWTSEAPSEPGWYWWRLRTNDPEVVFVDHWFGTTVMWQGDEKWELPFGETWSIPIEPPA